MPKNTIFEFDRTSTVQEVDVSNTVFVPIQINELEENEEAIGLTLCSTITELEDAFPTVRLVTNAEDSLEYGHNLGYKLASHLIKLGVKVLAQGVEVIDDVDWEKLKDKNLYDVRFLTTGAFKVSAVPTDMIDCAAQRGDCTALVSFNEADEAFTYAVADIKDTVEVIEDGGEYAAAFTPAFYSKHSSFSDGKVEVLIPSAFAYLFAYARSIKNNPEWFAIAGFERGIVPELSRLKHYYTSAEINELQNRTFEEGEEAADNVGIAINAIGYIRPAGDIIYGNRTLKNNEAEKGLTATSFLNVRNMISTIKKVAYEAANRFTFEQNSETLWVNYKSYIEPTLDRITHSNGAVGYSINRIKLANAKAKMKAEIIIQPIEAVEDIELSIIMTDTNTVVNE